MADTKPTLSEKRVIPYKVWHDRDGGACLNDAHGRLVAMFGYHPDGTPAMDEATECMVAVNFHERLVNALKLMLSEPTESTFDEFHAATDVIEASARALLSEIEKG